MDEDEVIFFLFIQTVFILMELLSKNVFTIVLKKDEVRGTEKGEIESHSILLSYIYG